MLLNDVTFLVANYAMPMLTILTWLVLLKKRDCLR